MSAMIFVASRRSAAFAAVSAIVLLVAGCGGDNTGGSGGKGGGTSAGAGGRGGTGGRGGSSGAGGATGGGGGANAGAGGVIGTGGAVGGPSLTGEIDADCSDVGPCFKASAGLPGICLGCTQ